MIAGSYSMMGSKHKVNQDSCYVNCNGKKCLCAVADGMGGHNAGDIASASAIRIISSMKQTDEKSILKAFNDANKEIYEMSTCDTSLSGMGTTIVLAFINKEFGLIANVGDSRAYCVSRSSVRQITVDHSYVQELINSGKITRIEAKTHPMRNVITMAGGVGSEITPNIKEVTFDSEDILLLCSDGVYGALSDEEIIQCCFEEMPEQAAETICRLAVKNGATDDVTAVVVRMN